ncbi:hypothetical protein NKH77_36600 [Streptomyces sp. M19]
MTRIHRKTGILMTAAVSSVLAGSLALAGTTGTAMAKGPEHPRGGRRPARPSRRRELQAQIETLGRLGGVLRPVTDLTGAVSRAPGGKLADQRLTRYSAAVRAAIVRARGTAAHSQHAGRAAADPGTPP